MNRTVLLRPFRRATAFARPVPDLILAGGIRCGSSSLYQHLKAAGCVGTLHRKEVHYFDRSFDRGEAFYRSFFPITQDRPVVDDTPSYLCTPGIAPRAAQVSPDAKVLMILRNPADRAVSHFAWRTRNGGERLATLQEALADEPNRMTDAVSMLGCYALHSRYEVGIEAWLEHFDRDRVCILIAERLFSGDADEAARLDDFVGLKASGPFPHTNHGPGGAPDPELDRLFQPTVTAVEALLGRSTGWAR